MKFQRVLSEDCRTQFLVQAVNQIAEIRSSLHAPNDVVRKSPREVSESVIRRLQNNSSWTDSETECRVPVCRTTVRGQTVKQSAEFQFAFEFFATAHKSTFCRQISIHNAEIAPPCTQCSTHFR